MLVPRIRIGTGEVELIPQDDPAPEFAWTARTLWRHVYRVATLAAATGDLVHVLGQAYRGRTEGRYAKPEELRLIVEVGSWLDHYLTDHPRELLAIRLFVHARALGGKVDKLGRSRGFSPAALHATHDAALARVCAGLAADRVPVSIADALPGAERVQVRHPIRTKRLPVYELRIDPPRQEDLDAMELAVFALRDVRGVADDAVKQRAAIVTLLASINGLDPSDLDQIHDFDLDIASRALARVAARGARANGSGGADLLRLERRS